jgi:formylglycine-generating enzyme required for sulfatase activity
VVGVTWYEALAYCHWLTERLRGWEDAPEPLARLLREEGWQVRLPSEAEWEKAARGTDGRAFPWGNEADPDRTNYYDTGIGSTSTVGCFPSGAGPYGIQDMSGNAWEWCATKYQDSYKDYQDDNDPQGNDARVLRGGAFVDDEWYVRCAARFGLAPTGQARSEPQEPQHWLSDCDCSRLLTLGSDYSGVWLSESLARSAL